MASTVISLRLSQEEKDQVSQKAKDSAMTINEYVKARLLYDRDDNNDSKMVPDIEKRNYLILTKSYALLKNLASLQFNPDQLDEIEDFAVDNAKQKNLFPKELK